jgi:nucleotide-binding universal stress UspA family protein
MNDPKILLTPLSTSGQVEERLQGALAVAQYFKAHLQVLHAQASPSQFMPRGVVGLSPKLWQEMETIADSSSRSDAQKLHQRFAQLAADSNIALSDSCLADAASASWHNVVGLRSEQVAQRGKVSDLLIIPKPKSGIATSTLEAALLYSGRPVLVMPRTQTSFSPTRISIAWNGSTEAARAVANALPFLTRAQQLRILTREHGEEKEPSALALQHYLKCHGINSQIEHLKQRSHDGEDLLDATKADKAELIVMGAYSHNRLHQQVFGGVTRHVLEHAEIPVLMSH